MMALGSRNRKENEMMKRMRNGELLVKVAARTDPEIQSFVDALEQVVKIMESSHVISNDRDDGCHLFMTVKQLEARAHQNFGHRSHLKCK